MGMFDTVHLKCKKCEADIEVQSKAGRCLLNDYDLDDVPRVIAQDLLGESGRCMDCGFPWKIEEKEESKIKLDY